MVCQPLVDGDGSDAAPGQPSGNGALVSTLTAAQGLKVAVSELAPPMVAVWMVAVDEPRSVRKFPEVPVPVSPERHTLSVYVPTAVVPDNTFPVRWNPTSEPHTPPGNT